MKAFRNFVACLPLALLLCAAAAVAAPKQAPLPRDSAYQLPATLTDQDGKSWDWRSKRGTPQVVAMFYTSCRFVCPLIIDSGKAVERALPADERAKLGLLLVSMDPERDTPEALMSVVRKRKLDTTRWSLASPKPDQVRSVAGVLGVRYRQLADGEFNHTSVLVLLDADGRIIARSEQIGSQLDPEFLAEVRRVLAR